MSSGSGVVAGPEIDMAELDAASSVPLSVDLSLNLGPSFALELALGGQDFEESVPVSRPNWNWPRFEPGMLAGGQEDEVTSTAEETTPEDQQGTASILAVLSRLNASNTSGGDLGQSVHEPDADAGRSLVGLLQSFRSARHSRYPRRPRQALFPPLQDLVQTQDTSEHGSTWETGALAANDTDVALLLPRTSQNDGTPSSKASDSAASPDSSNQNGKAGAVVGAGFECNVCLEMATEPVVTCCGHLFCWPCLFKWLHRYSSQKECPVCKGFISDDAITPIYGRGTSQAAETLSGTIPPRPHAHRVNFKRRWVDRFFGERFERVAAPAGPQVHVDRRQGETSNAAELVLNRLRVAQRLQREHFDRFRVHRLMHRRAGGVLRHRTTSAFGSISQASCVSPVPSSDQPHDEDVPTRIAMDHLETADSLAAIGASMDGLREGLEDMQRTLDALHTRPSQTAIQGPHRTADAESSSLVWPLLNEARAAHQSEAESPRHSTSALLHTESSELPETSRHTAASDAAGSSDLEPGSLHSRKRRRLN